MNVSATADNYGRLSALVVIHNEERRLADCLQTLAFVDELVVVLDKCTDESKNIAAQFTDRLLEGSWDIEGERRNLGIDYCQGKWILEVDADERVSPRLASEIREKIDEHDKGYFLVPFDNYIGKKLVRRGWGAYIGTNAKVCLFAKGSKRWGMQTIHPELFLAEEEYLGRLDHAMTHLIDEDVHDLLHRFNRYATAMAADPYHSSKNNSFIKCLLRIPARFYKCYLYKKGYQEGFYGFIIAVLAGLLPISCYLKSLSQKNDT